MRNVFEAILECGHDEDFVPVESEDFLATDAPAGRMWMVVMSLSLETPNGGRERVFAQEPRIRDTFLQVLFDHANIGGFDGEFTNGASMGVLRGELVRASKTILGPDIIDVLVTDVARQDLG